MLSTLRLAARAPALRLLLAGCLLLATSPRPAHAAPSRGVADGGREIASVEIAGNERVDSDAIKIHVRSRAGAPFNAATVDGDVRAIWAMGFFDDVAAEVQGSPGGERVVFRVKERPFIIAVEIDGNETLKKEDLEAALKIRPRTIYDPEKVRRGIVDAKKLYEEKSLLDATIEPVLDPGDKPNEVKLTYKIDEKEKVRISEIEFEGNEHLSDSDLEGVMATKSKSLISFITGSGTLNRDQLKTDAERITAFYYDHGYVNVRVEDPIVERKDDDLVVKFRIDEGEQFKFGKITFRVDMPPGEKDPFTEEELRQVGRVRSGETFEASALREDVEKLTDLYGDKGFAFANVEPETLVNPEDKTVDVGFRIQPGQTVSISQIQINGNTKTRDKVIRREMKTQEQEVFSATKLKRSRDALQRLGFFQEVNVTTRKADQPNHINVLVDVKEGSTGSFSAGAGYSSGDSFLFNVRVTENNLFGLGQRIVLNADIGTIRRNIYLAFTEPYLFDTRLSGTATAFSTSLIFDDFTRDSLGFSLRALYPLEDLGLSSLGPLSLEDTRAGIEYRLDRGRIFDIERDAPPAIYAEQGTTVISSMSPNLVRSTLNHAFDPTDGSYQDLSVEFAGLGGDTSFIRAEGRGRWFKPIYNIRGFGPLVGSIGGTVAYGIGQSGQSGREIPLVDRYFPGGISTVRGFKTRTLGPRQAVFDPTGDKVTTKPIGGSNEFILQNEFIFPIVQSLGLRGVLFFDLGNAFLQEDGIDFGNLRYSVGTGFRWLSPFGPLRVEFGVPLNAKDGEKKSLVLFSFGAPL